MDQLCATSSLPVTQTACSLPATTQPGTLQRRVIILPARGSISPIKVSTSPKRMLSPNVLSPVSGSVLPVCTAYANCGLADHKCAVAVKTTSESDSVCISSCVSQCVSSTLHSTSSEADDRTLSTALHVDGILTSSSENTSRHGIVSVACRGSVVQETSVLSPVTSVTRLSVRACSDSHSVSSGRNVTESMTSGHVCQPGNPVSQVFSDRISGAQVRPVNCEASLHHAVAVACSGVPGSQTVTSTRTVNVTSIRKISPSADIQKCNVVLKLFAENSDSLDVRTVEQCRPANVTYTGSANSPKCIVLLTSTATDSTSDICSPIVHQSSENMASVNVTTVCQPCSSLQNVTLVTNAANTISAVSSSAGQKVIEAMTPTLNGSQNNQVDLVVVDSSSLNTTAAQPPVENLSNSGKKSDDDTDDDSVVIIDADVVPSSPSPSRNNTKRSMTAQNIILLNRCKTSSQHAINSEQSAPKAVVADRKEQSRTKRKSVLGARLLESASDEGIILPASHLFENGSRISQPNRRKSFPQRRTDTSVPQLQFCTKQWKRDINSGQSATTSPACKRSQSRSPKKDMDADLRDKVDGGGKSKPSLLSQSNLQCSQNSCDKRKRKPVELSTLPEVKRSKRLSPMKSRNAYCNKNTEVTDSVVRKDAALVSGATITLLAADSTKTSNSIPVKVSSCSSEACAAANTNCYGNVKTTEPVTDSSSELQLLGKDKRSMEMSVTNEDGIVENLLVTIIDISSSEEEEEEDEVEVHSVSSVKLGSSEVSIPEVETSQSVTSKSLVSDAVKTLQVKSSGTSSTLASDGQPVSKSSCKPNTVRQKCRQNMQNSVMGRKVLVGQGRQPLNEDHVASSKVKQVPVAQSYGKSKNRKRSKNDAGGTVKQTKGDSDSVPTGHLGPIVRLYGSKDSPTSCSVVCGARDAEDETSARLKQKHVVLNSSCYPTSFQLQDSVPWKCVFCQQGSSYRTLGDLFGPYYAKSDSSGKSDDVVCQSSPSKSRSRSAKQSPESGFTTVSKNSKRRRQLLQKYVPSVARKSPKKSTRSPDKGVPSEIWLHEDCAVWTNGICLSPTGQLCGLEAAVTVSLQTVCSYFIACSEYCCVVELTLRACTGSQVLACEWTIVIVNRLFHLMSSIKCDGS